MIVRAAVVSFFAFCGAARAHDVWADGKAVPAWVKAACCGPDDVHHLRPDQVHRISDDYYMVDCYPNRIPASNAQPSQDGDYWIFYRDRRRRRGAVRRLLLLRADGLLKRCDRRPASPFGRRCRAKPDG
jgi:hypothetical protein